MEIHFAIAVSGISVWLTGRAVRIICSHDCAAFKTWKVQQQLRPVTLMGNTYNVREWTESKPRDSSTVTAEKKKVSWLALSDPGN